MQLVAVGVEPVGVIAIGANATGVVAVGQLATGVVAVGQLSRGVVVVGQLALGLVAVGQLALGLAWAMGMVGVASTAGPGLVYGFFGRLYVNRLLGHEVGPIMERPTITSTRMAVAAGGLLAIAALWFVAAGYPLADALTREGGVIVDGPRPLR
jgi:hypothetical protein